MRAAPARSVFVMLVLAAGIGVWTLTFSVVDAVVLKPLPIHRPEQLVPFRRDQDFKRRITPEIYWRLRDQLGCDRFWREQLAGNPAVLGGDVTIGKRHRRR